MQSVNGISTPPLGLFQCLLTLAGWGGCLFALWLQRRPRPRPLRWALRLLTAGLLCATLVLTGWSAYCYWFYHRVQPPALTRPLFPGVTYIRQSRRQPRPLVIHVVKIDLATPGLSFLVTPPDPAGGLPLRAQTTGAFAEANHLDLAINANFFSPFYSHGPLDYSPHAGQPVDVLGLAASRGTLYGARPAGYCALNISPANDATLTTGTLPAWYQTVAGDFLDLVPKVAPSPADKVNPRTAAGLDAAGKTLILLLVDGRQPNYSEGVTIAELGLLLKEFGAARAINLDGGGSTTLVARDRRGTLQILNSPIHTGIPHRQRPVGNHLGLRLSTAAR